MTRAAVNGNFSPSMRGKSSHAESLQIARFLVAGGTSTLGYLVLSLALIRWLPEHPVAVGIIAYLICLLLSFALQKYFAFRGDDAFSREFPRFLASALLGLTLSTFIVAIGTHLAIPPVWCYLAVAAVVAPLSYLLLDRFVFRLRKGQAGS
jgi:putative flippase GtrA